MICDYFVRPFFLYLSSRAATRDPENLFKILFDALAESFEEDSTTLYASTAELFVIPDGPTLGPSRNPDATRNMTDYPSKISLWLCARTWIPAFAGMTNKKRRSYLIILTLSPSLTDLLPSTMICSLSFKSTLSWADSPAIWPICASIFFA